MATLVLNAPKYQKGKPSYHNILVTGIGKDYAIASNEYSKLSSGASHRVVILSKDQRLRAEGQLQRLVLSGSAGNGIKRYDVYIQNLRSVQYSPLPLTRRGVSVF